MDLRDTSYIIENVGEYVFGYHRKLDEIRSSGKANEIDTK